MARNAHVRFLQAYLDKAVLMSQFSQPSLKGLLIIIFTLILQSYKTTQLFRYLNFQSSDYKSCHVVNQTLSYLNKSDLYILH